MAETPQINLQNPDEDHKKRTQNAKSQGKKQAKLVTVTADDWKRIFNMKNNNADKKKLETVKEAWDKGDFTQVYSKKKQVSKADLLRKYEEIRIQIRERKIKELVANIPANYKLVQNQEQLSKVLEQLNDEEVIAVDTETTGLNVIQGDDKLVGISLTLPKANIHYYIPVAHITDEPQLELHFVLNSLQTYLEDPDLGKVLHNAKFDMHVKKMYDLNIEPVIHDTMVAMWILNENEPSYKLKDLATKYLKAPSDSYGELFGNESFENLPLNVALAYAAKDTDLTYQLYEFQVHHLQRTGLDKVYYGIENPNIDVCVEMEQTGLILDQKFAQEYGKELKQEIDEIKARLVEQFGDINFNSPQQIQKVMYDDFKLPDVSKKRKTDVNTLKKLKDKHPGIDLLLQYRDKTKLYSTYIEALPQQIKKDGRIHGSFNQASTVTGRFASNNPNLQNIPPEARKMIVPPEGYVILGADYSQIEPRILAHYSQDEKFKAPYKRGEDLYASLASEIFNKPIEEIYDKSPERKKMKMGLLAVMYGVTIFTLAGQLGITVEEADEFISDFYKKYEDVTRWILEVWDFVKQNEYITTLYGRKRRFPGHRDKAIQYDQAAKEICERLEVDRVPFDVFYRKKELPRDLRWRFGEVKGGVESVRRMAVNAKIQGTAADIMKMALIDLKKVTRQKGWPIIGTVHDEALLYVPETIGLKDTEEIEEAMLSAGKLDVPMKIDVAFMHRWGDEIDKNEWFGLAN